MSLSIVYWWPLELSSLAVGYVLHRIAARQQSGLSKVLELGAESYWTSDSSWAWLQGFRLQHWARAELTKQHCNPAISLVIGSWAQSWNSKTTVHPYMKYTRVRSVTGFGNMDLLLGRSLQWWVVRDYCRQSQPRCIPIDSILLK